MTEVMESTSASAKLAATKRSRPAGGHQADGWHRRKRSLGLLSSADQQRCESLLPTASVWVEPVGVHQIDGAALQEECAEDLFTRQNDQYSLFTEIVKIYAPPILQSTQYKN